MDDFADLVHFDSDDEEYLIKAAEAMPNQTTREEGQVQVVCSYSPEPNMESMALAHLR